MPQFWTLGLPNVATVAAFARRSEEDGWDGMLVADSQNISGDCFTALALAARETDHLGLGTGVTNPVTRHPAVMAAAVASLQEVSGGRAVLGIGRGDSSLAHLGLAPASVAHLGRYVAALRGYLRGDAVSFEDLAPFAPAGGHRPVGDLALGAAPDGSRLGWLRASVEPPPVLVAASGPAVLELAATRADGVMIALGADTDRVAWAVDIVRGARAEAGLPGAHSVAVFVNVVAHPDVDVARSLVAGGVASVARFSVMHGTVPVPASDDERAVLEGIHRSYDMTAHTRVEASHTAALTAAFVDRFAIAGPPAHCVARLQELAALGVDRFVVMGPTAGADRDHARAAHRHLVEEVLPAFS